MNIEDEAAAQASANAQNIIDVTLALNLLAIYILACGIITALVARNNGRSIPVAFLAGLFLGPLGIAAHMIMGAVDSTNHRR